MPVALNDLRADRIHRQPELRHDLRFDLRRELAVGSDCPGQLSDRQAAGRPFEAISVAMQLERP